LPNRRVFSGGLAVAALAVSLVAGTGLAAAARSKHVVGARYNAQLDRKVLTTTRGLTLYSLSEERKGKFICKGSCLSVWHPLLIGAGAKPTGPVKLDTVKRPDNGRTQVTYGGLPLYTFSADSSPGQISGNGITDVGRWHVAALPRSG
jgi:predicted lipoprotein with Yx(FWY)xxD motif